MRLHRGGRQLTLKSTVEVVNETDVALLLRLARRWAARVRLMEVGPAASLRATELAKLRALLPSLLHERAAEWAGVASGAAGAVLQRLVEMLHAFAEEPEPETPYWSVV